MSYRVKTIPKFDKELKRMVKKYPSLKNEFVELVAKLQENPEQGTALGNHCFKIRLAVSSKGAGKSGGARVITCLQVSETTVYMLSIYDKSERESISDKELAELLKWIPQ